MKIYDLLLENDDKLGVLRKSITEKIPLTIQYKGPAGEVKSGPRFDIMPVVLGNNSKSNNLVIWAYVFKGVSKKGLPNWKMFRVDRIMSATLNPKLNNFNLENIPEYEKGKAPSMMKSLSHVDVFSPFIDSNKSSIPEPIQQPSEPVKNLSGNTTPVNEPVNEPVTSPNLSKRNHALEILNQITPRIKEYDGVKKITKQDYSTSIDSIYRKKEDEFKNYQRMIGGNTKTGEGTRKRFRIDAENEFNELLKTKNIQIEDMLSEIFYKFKHLIK